jgi:ribosomal protein S18 acetylase RimI-like enzyme
MLPIFRRSQISDLPTILDLLALDELGKTREKNDEKSLAAYLEAFLEISADENNFLAVVELNQEVIGTCHLVIMPSLTRAASRRINIEAVRISPKYSGQGIGSWMIKQAIEYGKNRGAKIVQLTTDKRRQRAHKFYERLGFEASHLGMKLFLQ